MSKPLNILLITSDQQHWDTLGIDNPRIKTPALDRLAREGTVYTRAYCNNPVCSPSRSTIITGLYPSTHGCWTIGVKLPEDVPTIGDIFQRQGYATALVGKAHFQPLSSNPDQVSIESYPILRDLDFWKNFHGPWYGFQHIELARNHADESHVGQHYALWMEEKGLKNWRDYFQPYPKDPAKPYKSPLYSWPLPEKYHYTTWTGERTIANIEQCVKEDKPFFIWSSFHDPHPDYLVPEPWASMYKPEDMVPGKLVPGEHDKNPIHFQKTQEKNPDFSMFKETEHQNHGCHSHLDYVHDLQKKMAIYYGMTSFMDDQIGRILDSLDRLGIADNTLVVFTTDHGHFLGQHGLGAKGPYHYEDLLRLPFIVRQPSVLPAGKRSSSLQSLVDLAPSFLTAAGIPVPGLMQGVNQYDTWKGETASSRDHVLVENRHQPTRLHLRTYIDGRYKMSIYRGFDFGEFFDLENDPNELNNLWDDPAHKEEKMRVMQKFVQAEIIREPTRYPRIGVA